MADDNRRGGGYEGALRYYSRALELDKSLVVGWVGQVQMLVQLGEYPQAELWARKSLELFPLNGELLAAQAHAKCRMGDMKTAHALSDGALSQKGESAYRWTVRGEIMVAAREKTDRHCFDKAQLADKDWLVPLEVGLIYLFYGLPSKALQRAQTAVERGSDAFYTWYVQGLCQQQLGFETSARTSFQRCLELSPRHVEAQQRIAELDQASWSLAKTLKRLWRRA